MTVHFDTAKTSANVEYDAHGGSDARRNSFYRKYGKRIFDVMLVVAASPVLVPLALIISVMIGMSGNRPVFVQRRVGINGREFRMLKFRTMVPDADNVLRAYLAENPAARAEWDAHQKLKNDPRITQVGRFLRKTSLDELPQFWNVVAGDMSLVGPRPMMVEQKAMYPGDAYYRMRPGITGLWQISDRNDCQFRDRAAFDTEYETILSLGTDIRVLSGTVGVVVRGTGY